MPDPAAAPNTLQKVRHASWRATKWYLRPKWKALGFILAAQFLLGPLGSPVVLAVIVAGGAFAQRKRIAKAISHWPGIPGAISRHVRERFPQRAKQPNDIEKSGVGDTGVATPGTVKSKQPDLPIPTPEMAYSTRVPIAKPATEIVSPQEPSVLPEEVQSFEPDDSFMDELPGPELPEHVALKPTLPQLDVPPDLKTDKADLGTEPEMPLLKQATKFVVNRAANGQEVNCKVTMLHGGEQPLFVFEPLGPEINPSALKSLRGSALRGFPDGATVIEHLRAGIDGRVDDVFRKIDVTRTTSSSAVITKAVAEQLVGKAFEVQSEPVVVNRSITPILVEPRTVDVASDAGIS